MQEKLKVPDIANVQIISVQKTNVDGEDYTDVRYAAYGSPYFQGSQLDAIVNQNRNEVSGSDLSYISQLLKAVGNFVKQTLLVNVYNMLFFTK